MSQSFWIIRRGRIENLLNELLFMSQRFGKVRRGQIENIVNELHFMTHIVQT